MINITTRDCTGVSIHVLLSLEFKKMTCILEACLPSGIVFQYNLKSIYFDYIHLTCFTYSNKNKLDYKTLLQAACSKMVSYYLLCYCKNLLIIMLQAIIKSSSFIK